MSLVNLYMVPEPAVETVLEHLVCLPVVCREILVRRACCKVLVLLTFSSLHSGTLICTTGGYAALHLAIHATAPLQIEYMPKSESKIPWDAIVFCYSAQLTLLILNISLNSLHVL